MNHGHQQPEIIVIGAGLGGLASALLLARAGAKVRVLEGAHKPGGRARSRLQDGFTLNVGPHAFFRSGPAQQVLRQLGVPLHGRALAKRGAYGLLNDRVHELPYTPLLMLRSKLLDTSEKLQFLQVLAGLSERRAQALTGLTVKQWLEQAVSSPRTRALFDMLVRLSCYAHAPELLSADIAVRQVAHTVRHNVMYLDGGWQRAAVALARGDQPVL